MHHIFNVHRSINVCLNKDPKVINCLWLSINISFNISSKIFLHQLLSCKFRPWCFSRFSILRTSYLFLSSVEDMRLSFSIPEKFNLTNVFSYTALSPPELTLLLPLLCHSMSIFSHQSCSELGVRQTSPHSSAGKAPLQLSSKQWWWRTSTDHNIFNPCFIFITTTQQHHSNGPSNKHD